MTFEELMKLPVQKSDQDANALLGHRYNHLQMDDPLGHGWYVEWQNVEGLEFKYLEDFCYDGRRTWTLCFVEYHGVPFMMFKNAGREGDDHYDSAVFSAAILKDVQDLLVSLLDSSREDANVFSLKGDASDFEEFYGDSIHTPFVHY